MSQAYQKFLDAMGAAWQWFDKLFDAVFPHRYNPNYFLGGITNLFLWACILSGLVLYAYYVPTLAEAWRSVDYLKIVPYGSVMRAIHRFAGDAMWVALTLHMARTWFTRRERKFRYVAWMSGVILLALTLMTGVTGYLLVWDDRAAALASMTSKMLASIPILGDWAVRLFIGGGAITDYTLTRFFTFHIGIPFLMLFFLWMHYLRINRPVIYPPALLSMALIGFVVLAAGLPALGGRWEQLAVVSGPPAGGPIPSRFGVDIFYMWGYLPLQSGVAPWLVLLLSVLVLAFLFYVPYLARDEYRDVVQVINENCTGCGLCAEDCHANAIEMVPALHAPRRGGKNLLAQIIAPRCAECGICVGACPFDALEMPLLRDRDVEEAIARGLR